MAKINEFPLIDKTFDDAMELLQDTQKFVIFRRAPANDVADPFEEFLVTAKTTQLVSYLTNIMSWILWQKAANRGELSSQEADKIGEKHLSREIFSKRQDAFEVDLPNALNKLIVRSFLLQDRVCRISRMAGSPTH